MTQLRHQTCLNHPVREAVGRCLECRQFFCRECITEHAGRLICAGCLGKIAQRPAAKSRSWFKSARSLVTALIAFAAAWLFFYSMGESLMRLPSAFHADSIWQQSFSFDSR